MSKPASKKLTIKAPKAKGTVQKRATHATVPTWTDAAKGSNRR